MTPGPTALDSLLAPGSLSTRFQPIYTAAGDDRRVELLECLTRGPEGSNMHSAGVLFEYVRRKGQEATLDRLCVASALRTIAMQALRIRPRLSLNVHAATLERDPRFVSFFVGCAEASLVPLSNLTLEIVEHAPSWSGPGFLTALADLRRHGVAIALDDVGLGQSNYRMILDCEPDYLKIDRYLVSGCHGDYRRQAVLDSLVHLGHSLGTRLVAEGVENKADLNSVGLLGIDFVQGYFLSRPLSPEKLKELLECSAKG